MTKTAVKVYLIDEHLEAREQLEKSLEENLDIDLCGVSSSVEEALMQLELIRPHVILYDVKMANRRGIAGLDKIRATLPEARLIVTTSYADPTEQRQVIQHGAYGYWVQQQSLAKLLQMILPGKAV